MILYIIRHGQTLWNLEERKQGWADSPLTNKGIAQAKIVSNILKQQNVDISSTDIFVSPLFRTRQYAEIIFGEQQVKSFQLSHLIKEHGFGAWEGLNQQEVDEKFPGETEKRLQDWWNYVIPGGGESYAIISQRAQCFLKEIETTPIAVVVCHEMISKVMRGLLVNLTTDETLKLDHPQDTIYRIEDGVIESLT